MKQRGDETAPDPARETAAAKRPHWAASRASRLPGLRARFGSRWLAAFVAALCLIGAALYLARDVVAVSIARGARDLLLVAAPHPYIAAIEWTGGRFVLSSQFLFGVIRIEMASIWIILAFPSAFGLSFPQSSNRVGSAAAALASSFIACCALLAMAAEIEFGMVLKEQGLNIVPPWRMGLVRGAWRLVGDSLPIAYPVIACLWIARRRANRRPPEGANARFESQISLRRRLVFAGVIFACVAVGTRAGLLAEDTGRLVGRADYAALGSWNSNLEDHLVQRGELESGAGHYGKAAHFFFMALEYGLQRDALSPAEIQMLAEQGDPAARAFLENRDKLLEVRRRRASRRSLDADSLEEAEPEDPE